MPGCSQDDDYSSSDDGTTVPVAAWDQLAAWEQHGVPRPPGKSSLLPASHLCAQAGFRGKKARQDVEDFNEGARQQVLPREEHAVHAASD